MSDHGWVYYILFILIPQISMLCGTLHTILPPWEGLDDFPTAQKYYKFFIYVIGYMAGSARSTLYRKSISIEHEDSVNGPNGANTVARAAAYANTHPDAPLIPTATVTTTAAAATPDKTPDSKQG